MNRLLSQLSGSDSDRLQAMLCRWQTVVETIDLFANRIDELNEEWADTEAAHGDARRAAILHRDGLLAQEQERIKARVPVVRELAERQAAATTIWYRIYLWLRKLQSQAEPALRIVALAEATKKLNDFDKKSDALGELIMDAKREVQRLNAPFDDVAFARARLTEDREAAIMERLELENSVRDGVARALVDRPIWAIKQTAALIDGLEAEDLLQLRRDMRPALAAADAAGSKPPPLKPIMEIGDAVEAGFTDKSSAGTGSVSS